MTLNKLKNELYHAFEWLGGINLSERSHIIVHHEPELKLGSAKTPDETLQTTEQLSEILRQAYKEYELDQEDDTRISTTSSKKPPVTRH